VWCGGDGETILAFVRSTQSWTEILASATGIWQEWRSGGFRSGWKGSVWGSESREDTYTFLNHLCSSPRSSK
jgi:hypothetical protein